MDSDWCKRIRILLFNDNNKSWTLSFDDFPEFSFWQHCKHLLFTNTHRRQDAVFEQIEDKMEPWRLQVSQSLAFPVSAAVIGESFRPGFVDHFGHRQDFVADVQQYLKKDGPTFIMPSIAFSVPALIVTL